MSYTHSKLRTHKHKFHDISFELITKKVASNKYNASARKVLVYKVCMILKIILNKTVSIIYIYKDVTAYK